MVDKIKVQNGMLQDKSLELYLACLDLYSRNERLSVCVEIGDGFKMLEYYNQICDDIVEIKKELSLYEGFLSELKREMDKEV